MKIFGLLLLFHLYFVPEACCQQPMEIQLYPNGVVPNSKPVENREKTTKNPDNIFFTTETSIPTLSFFAPTTPNGQAIIVCPGGGYWGTAGDHEGIQVAEALRERGITVFVLKYRVPDERTCIEPSLAPLQDAQQAIRLVRSNAKKWRINPQKIGIMGFSAGGHLAATAATLFHFKADPQCIDTTSARPDFVILVYPVISFLDTICHSGSREKLLGKQPAPAQMDFFSTEKQVTRETPPVFLVHAQNDGVVSVENSITFYLSCTRNGVAAEMHLYPEGGHGFGLKNPTTDDLWLDRVFNWLKQL